MTKFYELCPKCNSISGNDWSQCNKLCPMPASPHFDAKLGEKLHERGVLLHEITEKFWVDFSKLVREALTMTPEEDRDDVKAMLQDKSSVYGCDLEGKYS